MKSRHAHLLDDRDVRRWYENVARGSRITADVYLRKLGNFCSTHNITPKSLLKMRDEELQNFLMDSVTDMESKGYAGSYVETLIKIIRSWLSHNRRELKGRIKIKGAEDTPSLKDERVPTKDELKSIFLSGDRKSRVACALVAHCGVRIEVIGNYLGDDGLRLKDLPEMVMAHGEVGFTKMPTIVMVRKGLSKARHQYFTFLSEEGCGYLKDYLEERMRQGEELTRDSPIVTPKRRMKPFIKAINVGDAIRAPIRKAGFPWRPYVLRSYFDTQMMLAESKGLVLRDYRQFWMGHKGDIEARYTTNKGRLPEEVVEDMREAYRRAQDYLSTSKVEVTSEEQIRQAFKRQLLLVAGFKQEEVEKMDLSSMGDDEFQEMVRQRLLGMMVNNGARQKVIGVDALEQFLAQGWEFVSTLPGERAVIRIPG